MNRNLIASLLSLALVTVALGVGGGAASAGTQGSGSGGNCGGDDTKARLFENIIDDTAWGNDSAWQCQWQSNLNNKAYTIEDGAGCRHGFGNRQHWGDCISSVRPFTVTGKQICVYEDINYSGWRKGWNSGQATQRYDLGQFDLNDAVSSINWVDGGTCWT